MSSEPTTVQSDLSELIAENFGANATYVETLLARFQSDPSLVDESWRAYFEELIGETAVSETAQAGRAVTLPQADGGGTVAAASSDGKSASAAARATTK